MPPPLTVVVVVQLLHQQLHQLSIKVACRNEKAAGAGWRAGRMKGKGKPQKQQQQAAATMAQVQQGPHILLPQQL